MIILAAAGVDVRAGGGARLRLGGAGGGIGASEGDGVLLEAPGGSFQTTVARGVEAMSGTVRPSKVMLKMSLDKFDSPRFLIECHLAKVFDRSICQPSFIN